MTTPEITADAAALAERRHLIALGFRMLGTLADAEDAVQETYIRWFRMPASERSAIESPRAWLTRAAGRVCLDMLGSARARRERYVGPWLPEPVPAFAVDGPIDDPLERAAVDESVGSALMVVLEAMTPAERVVFVLHEVFGVPFAEIEETVGRSAAACRQLAASARRRVDRDRARRVPRAEHDAVVRAFAEATRSGDLARIVALLDPSVELRSDGGGVVTAARKPVVGSDRVARFLLGILEKGGRDEVTEVVTPDGVGFALHDDGRVAAVMTLGVAGGDRVGSRITEVRIVLNPAKLGLWNPAGGPRARPRDPDPGPTRGVTPRRSAGGAG